MTYPPPPDPYDPTRGFPAPPPESYPQQAPPPRRRAWPWAVLAVALVAGGATAYVAYDRGIIVKDSGIKACEALRDDTAFTGSAQNKDPLTEAAYRELRGVFEASRYDDIKDHGTKLMDVLWQVSQFGEEPGVEALAYVGPLTTHLTGLQSACADQGIFVKLTPAANPSAAAPSVQVNTPAAPACSTVFAAGKKIPKDFAGECSDAQGQPWSVFGVDCNDGRKLYRVDPASGAAPGWGYSGGRYRADDTSKQDSKYFAAMNDCTG